MIGEFHLSGGITFTDFVEEVGSTIVVEAIDVLLDFIGLKGIITQDPCNTAAITAMTGMLMKMGREDGEWRSRWGGEEESNDY